TPTPPTLTHRLSLHDALPISAWRAVMDAHYASESAQGLTQTRALGEINRFMRETDVAVGSAGSLPGDMQRLWRPGEPGTYHMERSEEHTSELQSRFDLVCRLL